MRRLYNALFFLFFLLSAPYYFTRLLRRGRWQEGFRQRFGRYNAKLKQALTNRHVIWLHAVSVGEVNVCTQLIRALEPRAPNLKLVVSTTTSTGMAELRRKLPSHIEKIYYPIDRHAWVRRAVNVIHPEAVIFVEAEIWPNFIWRLRDMRIPAFLVNARLSDRSYRGYRRFGFLFRQLFASFEGVGAQNEADATRLRELGCRPEAVQVVGSLKFDAAKLEERRELDVPALLAQIGVLPGAPVLLGGSTHPGEEGILADVFRSLRRQHPDLFLVLVPRHFERSRDAGRELEQRRIPFVYRSELTASSRFEPGELQCLLVNTTGELRFFYEHATVVFVGKSLAAHGGQNPIEPAAFGKAMVFGPHMENFEAIVKAFLAAEGAQQVRDSAELEGAIDVLLKDPERRQRVGARALQVVQDNRGAIDRTVDMILDRLGASELYVAPDR
ncbi:MAG: 3-deoxy-D-manno-octulosonic acid transferase [Verrucomicrobia bacterium]|nr:3-deoxy-D-manno-octulosonic acid transferase [Verrucomicrobiota bacterium]